ncbi:hypothetical protein L3X38_018013 [Prunus dulcis]|uniref:Reverse transcriptase Ty1/copia-type domain-containing protein n=1 Tax=Prunus dulcis TaxID=3755 RepID=A0AAD4W900_PRUDU|nr:hypothetical protein L3X38_018013 [Prunus dulcis]
MLNELKSMKNNQVWELIEPHKSQKLVDLKWGFKTKKDKDGKIGRFNARLVAKGFTQREGIDYIETFSRVSTKDSFLIIMALVAHYYLLLHQMDVKIGFLNGELEEVNFMRIFLKEHCPKNKEEEAEMRNKPYASLVGSIMYAQVCTRPNIALCITKMGRFQSNPGMQHWIVGKKILRYLHRRKAYMLIYRHTENSELVGYADVNIRKAEDDYISTSGFLFKIAGVAVAWKSAKQSGVLNSTMFSEYIACYEATSHAVWLWNFIEDIKVVDSISRPV